MGSREAVLQVRSVFLRVVNGKAQHKALHVARASVVQRAGEESGVARSRREVFRKCAAGVMRATDRYAGTHLVPRTINFDAEDIAAFEYPPTEGVQGTVRCERCERREHIRRDLGAHCPSGFRIAVANVDGDGWVLDKFVLLFHVSDLSDGLSLFRSMLHRERVCVLVRASPI